MRSLKVYISFLLCLCVGLTSFSFADPIPAYTPLSADQLEAEAAILIDQNTGQILFEKNANQQLYPASTTKVMTAILVLEDMDLHQEIVVDDRAPNTEGSSISLDYDEELTVEQLLYAVLLDSANDAAAALAIAHSGSIEAFADRMNERAAELGALNTHFTNPHGLPDKEHLTTAYDLSRIGMYAMTFPKFREIVQTVRYDILPTNKKEETRFLKNSNRFLFGTGSSNKINYNGQLIDIKWDAVTGMKTGYTIAAQQTFIASAEKDGLQLIAVILKSKGKAIWTDTRAMLEHGFDNYDPYTLVSEQDLVDTLRFEDMKKTRVDAVAASTVQVLLPLGVTPTQIERQVNYLPDIALPIKAGQHLGDLLFYKGDTLIGQTKLIAPTAADDQLLLTNETTTLIKEPGLWYEDLPWFQIMLKALLTLFIWRILMTLFHSWRRRHIRASQRKEGRTES